MKIIEKILILLSVLIFNVIRLLCCLDILCFQTVIATAKQKLLLRGRYGLHEFG